MIASHYAEPVDRRLTAGAELHDAPSGDSPVIARLEQGDAFALLDSTLGWAWGYAGAERRVGYVESAKIGR
ncbi:MAG: SH3 domain-containing protein [Sphingomicrobium sp.]